MSERRWFYEDEAERRKWQDPEAILSEAGLEPGATFVDIGCGEGFFALPAARMVGEAGKVYATDISSAAINQLKERAAKEGLRNLETRAGKAEETVPCQSCADIVFFGIVLHDFADPVKVLSNASKMLKPAGKLVNLDWKKQPMSLGPPLFKRFSEEQAIKLIESVGFRVTDVTDSGSYHYLIIARPL